MPSFPFLCLLRHSRSRHHRGRNPPRRQTSVARRSELDARRPCSERQGLSPHSNARQSGLADASFLLTESFSCVLSARLTFSLDRWPVSQTLARPILDRLRAAIETATHFIWRVFGRRWTHCHAFGPAFRRELMPYLLILFSVLFNELNVLFLSVRDYYECHEQICGIEDRFISWTNAVLLTRP